MPNSLTQALRPINRISYSATGALKLAPDFEFPRRVAEFAQAWQDALPNFHKDPDNARCVEEFFDQIERICGSFSDFDQNTSVGSHSRFFLSALMLNMPWEFLPEAVRRERINRILQNQALRERLWEQHLEDLIQRLSENPGAGLGMGSSFAKLMLIFADIRTALIALPLEQTVVFFRDLPDLIFQMPDLLAELSEEKIRVFLQYQLDQTPDRLQTLIQIIERQYWSNNKFLNDEVSVSILVPLAENSELPLSVRSQANFVVASIYVGRHELASAKPYLDRIRQLDWGLSQEYQEEAADFLALCEQADSLAQQEQSLSAETKSIIQHLTALNSSLKQYLAQRKPNSILYTLGFFNSELSKKKNQMVEGLSKTIETQIANLRTGKSSEVSAEELSTLLTAAVARNKQIHLDYARPIDGPGQLGGKLSLAEDSLKKFMTPIVASEPQGSPRGMGLASD